MLIQKMKKILNEPDQPKTKEDKFMQAATNFAKNMYKIVQGAALNKKLRDFLDSEDFINTIYNIMRHANSAIVDSQKHLSTKELKPLQNRKATTEEILTICEKLRIGMQDILTNSEELDYNTILFQGLFVYYTENLTHKLEVNK